MRRQPTHTERFRRHLPQLVFSGLAVLTLAIATLPTPLEAQRRSKLQPRQTSLFDQNRQIDTIYYPAEAGKNDLERKAAYELARYLKKLSGKEWQVLPEPQSVENRGIFVGRTRRAFVDGLWDGDRPVSPLPLPTDKTDLKAIRERIVIVGENPRATLSGVYRFLQTHAGIDWFAPDKSGEEVPELASLRVAQGTHRIQPDFRDRSFYFFTRNPVYRQWREQIGASTHFSANHNLHRIFTPEVYESHPEYWASIDGVRPYSGKRASSGIQLDYTNPDVARLTAEAAGEFFNRSPQRLAFSLGINDSIDFGNDEVTLDVVSPFRYWRGHPVFSDLIFAFTNAVAKEVAQTHPDRYLPMLAYMWGEAPPSFPLEPNLFPFLCIDHAQWYDKERRDSDMELTRAWAQSGAKQLGSWEYYAGTGYFIPRFFPTASAESLKFIHDLGYDSVFFECGTNTGFDAPKMWLAAQLAWDIDADPSALLNRFYTGYYGAAAAPMQQFFELCEAQWMQQEGRSFWLKYHLNPAQAELYPPQVLAQLEALLDEAKAKLEAANAPARFFERLKLTEDSFAYLKAASEFYHSYRRLILMPLADAEAEAIENFSKEFTVFKDATAALKAAPQTRLDAGWDLRPQMLGLSPEGRLLTAFIGNKDRLSADTLGQTHIFPAAAAAANVFFIEDFSSELIEGDADGIGPMAPARAQATSEWNVRWTHHEGASLQRVTAPQTADGALPASDGDSQYALKLENQEFLSVYRWLPLPTGTTGAGFSLQVLGALDKGTQMEIRLSWLDADHKPLGTAISSLLPPESYKTWHDIAIATEIPKGAEWMYVGFRLRQQSPGQPLHLRNWQAFSW